MIEKIIDKIINDKDKEINILKERIDKAIEITHKLLMNSADNQLIAKEEEMEYFEWSDEILEKQLEILKGDEK